VRWVREREGDGVAVNGINFAGGGSSVRELCCRCHLALTGRLKHVSKAALLEAACLARRQLRTCPTHVPRVSV
jgi:hypothetical protein